MNLTLRKSDERGRANDRGTFSEQRPSSPRPESSEFRPDDSANRRSL